MDSFYRLAPGVCYYECADGYYPNDKQPFVVCDVGRWLVEADNMFVKWIYNESTKQEKKVYPPSTGESASCMPKSCDEYVSRRRDQSAQVDIRVFVVSVWSTAMYGDNDDDDGVKW